MTPEQRKRMSELCQQVQTETNTKRFTQLIYELNVLLQARQIELNKGITNRLKASEYSLTDSQQFWTMPYELYPQRGQVSAPHKPTVSEACRNWQYTRWLAFRSQLFCAESYRDRGARPTIGDRQRD